MTTTGRQLDWLPTNSRRANAVRSGEAWDAVRVGADPGERALRALGTDSGAVIEDVWAGLLYWLIPAGGADGWATAAWPNVRVLGVNTWLTVPGLQCAGNPHWRIRPTEVDDYLTDPDRLLAALRLSLLATGAECVPHDGSPA